MSLKLDNLHNESQSNVFNKQDASLVSLQPPKKCDLLLKLLHLNTSSHDQIPENWAKFITELDHVPYDSINDFQLEQILKFVNSEPYARATKFLEDENIVFRKCTLPKEQQCIDEHFNVGIHKLNPKTAAQANSSLNDQERMAIISSVKQMNVMTEEEELASLNQLLRNMPNWFGYDYSQLDWANIERLFRVEKYEEKNMNNKKVFHLIQKMRSKISQRWTRLKLRLNIYRQYFVSRLFNSANCIITCWLFCFCASLFH